MEPDRSQHDRPATSVIAQQYSSAIVSLSFCSSKENCDASLIIKCYLVFTFYCASLKSRNFNCVSRVASVRAWITSNFTLQRLNLHQKTNCMNVWLIMADNRNELPVYREPL